MKTSIRCRTALLGLTSLLIACGAHAQAEKFPARPIRIIVPFTPGGSLDLAARLIGAEVNGAMGQTVIVENRAGAGTLIGTRAVAQAAPDGYTLLLHVTTMMTNAIAHKSPGYTMADFTPVLGIGNAQCMLSANGSVPFKNIAELIAYARAKPGVLNVSGIGGGGVTNLLWERFRRTAGLKVQDIMYPGSAGAVQALLAGDTHLFLSAPASVAQHIAAGKLKGLAVTGPQRLSSNPDIATFKEQNFPTMSSCTWYGIFAPAKTPEAVVSALRRGLEAARDMPASKGGLIKAAIEPWSGSAQEFASFLASEQAVWEKDIKESGFTIE